MSSSLGDGCVVDGVKYSLGLEQDISVGESVGAAEGA